MKKEWLLVRHGKDDESYINKTLDNPLTKEGMSSIDALADKIVSYFYSNSNKHGIDLMCSDKLRAMQSAEILMNNIQKENIPINLFFDRRLRGFDQGVIAKVETLPYAENAKILALARNAFEEKYIKQKDYSYRFGESINTGEYKNLGENFEIYGENQNEYLDRIYKFLYDNLTKPKNDNIDIIVTHANTIDRIKKIFNSCQLNPEINIENDTLKVPHGEFVNLEIINEDLCIKSIKNKIDYGFIE